MNVMIVPVLISSRDFRGGEIQIHIIYEIQEMKEFRSEVRKVNEKNCLLNCGQKDNKIKVHI